MLCVNTSRSALAYGKHSILWWPDPPLPSWPVTQTPWVVNSSSKVRHFGICQGWWLTHRSLSTVYLVSPYPADHIFQAPRGGRDLILKLIFLLANLAQDLLLSPKIPVLTACPHAWAAWCSLHPSSFQKWVPISFSTVDTTPVFLPPPLTEKTNCLYRTLCTQVSLAPGNANWNCKKMKTFLENFWCFGECFWADHTLTSSSIVTIQSCLPQGIDFSHLTLEVAHFSPNLKVDLGLRYQSKCTVLWALLLSHGICIPADRHRQEIGGLCWWFPWS